MKVGDRVIITSSRGRGWSRGWDNWDNCYIKRINNSYKYEYCISNNIGDIIWLKLSDIELDLQYYRDIKITELLR